MLKIKCERMKPDDPDVSSGCDYGHMTFTGDLGRLTSISDTTNLQMRAFMLQDAINALVNGLEKLLSDEDVKVFRLRTWGDAHTLRVWFVKKPGGMVAVRSLPESDDPEDSMMDRGSLRQYEAMLRYRPGDSEGYVVSVVCRDDLIRAVTECLLEFADGLVEKWKHNDEAVDWSGNLRSLVKRLEALH